MGPSFSPDGLDDRNSLGPAGIGTPFHPLRSPSSLYTITASQLQVSVRFTLKTFSYFLTEARLRTLQCISMPYALG